MAIEMVYNIRTAEVSFASRFSSKSRHASGVRKFAHLLHQTIRLVPARRHQTSNYLPLSLLSRRSPTRTSRGLSSRLPRRRTRAPSLLLADSSDLFDVGTFGVDLVGVGKLIGGGAGRGGRRRGGGGGGRSAVVGVDARGRRLATFRPAFRSLIRFSVDL